MNFLKLIVILFAFTSYTLKAQCTANASNFGNNTGSPSYNVSGDISVSIENNAQDITLNLGSNFRTASGPDIRVYLIQSEGESNSQLAQLTKEDFENLELIEFGLVGSNTINQNGAKSFTVAIPNGVNIEEYDKVLFYCKRFNAFWDVGNITPFSPQNCSILSVEDVIFQGIDVLPNPAVDVVSISNADQIISKVRIFDIQGSMVLNTNKEFEKIDISSLGAGVYLVQLSANDDRITKLEKLLVTH